MLKLKLGKNVKVKREKEKGKKIEIKMMPKIWKMVYRRGGNQIM